MRVTPIAGFVATRSTGKENMLEICMSEDVRGKVAGSLRPLLYDASLFAFDAGSEGKKRKQCEDRKSMFHLM